MEGPGQGRHSRALRHHGGGTVARRVDRQREPECCVKLLDCTLVPQPPTDGLRRAMMRRQKRARVLCEAKVSFLGRFYVKGFSEDNVNKLRSNIRLSGGTKTRLRLTTEGVSNGYSGSGSVFRNKMPAEFVPLEDVFEILVDAQHTTVVLVTVQIAEGHFEVQAYRFKDHKSAFVFQQTFANVKQGLSPVPIYSHSVVDGRATPLRTSTPAERVYTVNGPSNGPREWEIVGSSGDTLPRRMPVAMEATSPGLAPDSVLWQGAPRGSRSVSRRSRSRQALITPSPGRMSTYSQQTTRRRSPSPGAPLQIQRPAKVKPPVYVHKVTPAEPVVYPPAQPSKVYVHQSSDTVDGGSTVHSKVHALREEVDYLRTLLEERRLLDGQSTNGKPFQIIQMNETMGEDTVNFTKQDLERFEAKGGTVRVKVRDYRHTVNHNTYNGFNRSSSYYSNGDGADDLSESTSIHDLVGSTMYSDDDYSAAVRGTYGRSAREQIRRRQASDGWSVYRGSVRGSPSYQRTPSPGYQRALSQPAPLQRGMSSPSSPGGVLARSVSTEPLQRIPVPLTSQQRVTSQQHVTSTPRGSRHSLRRLIPVTPVDTSNARIIYPAARLSQL